MVYAVGVFMQRCRDMHRVDWSVIVITRTYIPWSQFSCVHGSCTVPVGMHSMLWLHKCEFVCSLPAPFHSVLACYILFNVLLKHCDRQYVYAPAEAMQCLVDFAYDIAWPIHLYTYYFGQYMTVPVPPNPRE